MHAPFAGIVRSESVAPGQFVTVGQFVGRLYAADAVEVEVPLSDADAALVPGLWELRAGDADPRVVARVDYGDASYAWEGYVDRVEATLDEQTRTLDVIVHVADPLANGAPVEVGGAGGKSNSGTGVGGFRGPPLLVGKFVAVRLDGFVPEEYFRGYPGPRSDPANEVWALQDDVLTIIPVRVLQTYDASIYVTGALAPGQPVVGGIEIAEGMVVQTVSGNR